LGDPPWRNTHVAPLDGLPFGDHPWRTPLGGPHLGEPLWGTPLWDTPWGSPRRTPLKDPSLAPICGNPLGGIPFARHLFGVPPCGTRLGEAKFGPPWATPLNDPDWDQPWWTPLVSPLLEPPLGNPLVGPLFGAQLLWHHLGDHAWGTPLGERPFREPP
jgi:hypothetical protein